METPGRGGVGSLYWTLLDHIGFLLGIIVPNASVKVAPPAVTGPLGHSLPAFLFKSHKDVMCAGTQFEVAKIGPDNAKIRELGCQK